MARFLMLGGMGYLYSSLAVNAVAECANTRKRYPLAVPIFLTEIIRKLNIILKYFFFSIMHIESIEIIMGFEIT